MRAQLLEFHQVLSDGARHQTCTLSVSFSLIQSNYASSAPARAKSIRQTDASSQQRIHPLLLPEILLYVVDFILCPLTTPAARWTQLNDLMLLNKQARSTLISRAKLWRWVDLENLVHLKLMIERAQDREVRPVLVAQSSNASINIASVQVALASLSSTAPPLIPDVLCLRLEVGTPGRLLWDDMLSSKYSGSWRSIRYLRLSSGLLHGFPWHDENSRNLTFQVDLGDFPHLERLHLEHCMPPKASKACLTLTHLRMEHCPMTPFQLQVADWSGILPHTPNLKALYLLAVPVSGVMVEATLDKLEELHLSNLQGANHLMLDCPVLEKATFSTGGTGWWSERQMIHPGALDRMVCTPNSSVCV